MADALAVYFAALERLKNNRPVHVPKDIKITNDSVSLEAGRKKGSIKKSRPAFHDLIREINAAAEMQAQPKNPVKEQLVSAKEEARKYRILWEEALAREVSLVNQLWVERKEWAMEKSALTGERVSAILSKKRTGDGRH